MLNWRRDPDYEQQMLHFEQRKMQHEWRMKQLAKDIEQIEKETKQIERETERLKQENARGRQLLASIDALCFRPASSSTPASATEPISNPSSP